MSGDAHVRDEQEKHRYLIELDGEQIGLLSYRLRGDQIALTHAEIDPAHEGQGLGGQLAAFALDDARRRGLSVVPACPFVREYILRNPGYGDLLSPEDRARTGLD
jgi:predicted GNAT family acetyltransferase